MYCVIGVMVVGVEYILMIMWHTSFNMERPQS